MAVTAGGGVWWEGMTDEPPAECDRLARATLDSGDCTGHGGAGRAPERAFHRAGRASVRSSIPTGSIPTACRSARSCSAAGARDTIPLVYQTFNWTAGVYAGATMGSETTAAAAGAVGRVRRDPMAMLPFCGYHMGDYFRHWIRMQRSLSETPKIFHVNWFRKDADGKFLWPGFRENMRILQVDRRSRPRPRARAGDVDRLDAALRGHRLDRPAVSRAISSRRSRRSIQRRGAAK